MIPAAPLKPLTAALGTTPEGRTRRERRVTLGVVTLGAASILALAAFAWPFFAASLPEQSQAAAPVVAFALLPILLLSASLMLDSDISNTKTIAMLGILAAIGTVLRIASTGVGGFEAVFIVLILAGRAFGVRFGFLLGMLTIAVSSLVWGGIGPWTPFQMFAAGWVAAGAGVLRHRPRRPGATERSGRIEIAWLIGYAVVASYVFGAVMNLWFWPFAVGTETSISYVPGAPVGENLASFGLYTLLTSTFTWDTVRAITTALGILLVGRPVLAALRRARL